MATGAILVVGFKQQKIHFLEESGGCNQPKMGMFGMNQPKWIFDQILSDLTATFGFGLGILVRTIRLV